jgi:plastocyanin
MKMSATTISLLALFALAACDKSSHANVAAPAQAIAGNGIIRGEVKFIGIAPEMKPITTTEACCKTDPPLAEENIVVNSNNTLRNVFVYLQDAPPSDGAAQPAVLLDQVHCKYIPHAIALQVGQTLRIRSSDPTMHNVHLMSEKNPAKNLAMVQAGQENPLKFDYAEIIHAKCDVHPWMSAWVGVFDNPYFAITADDGSFEIKNIPPGTYKLIAWHEMYGRQEKTVTVADDKPADMNIVFGKE